MTNEYSSTTKTLSIYGKDGMVDAIEAALKNSRWTTPVQVGGAALIITQNLLPLVGDALALDIAGSVAYVAGISMLVGGMGYRYAMNALRDKITVEVTEKSFGTE